MTDDTAPDGTTKLLLEAMSYAQHDSWRCEHRPHFYYADGPPVDGMCPCGLDELQARVLALVKAEPEYEYRACPRSFAIAEPAIMDSLDDARWYVERAESIYHGGHVERRVVRRAGQWERVPS